MAGERQTKVSKVSKIVVWRCPECRLLSEDGGTQPHRQGCSLDGKSGVALEPAYRGVRCGGR